MYTKIKKIVEVLLTDNLELAEVEMDSMPSGVYFLSKAKGVLKFARSEEACDAYFAKQKEIADAKAAKKAEEAEKKAVEEEAARKAAEEVAPTEEVVPTEEVAPTEEVVPTEEVAPTEEETPTEEVDPTEEVVPTEEVAPTEEVVPTEEVAPAEEEAPAEEVAPAEEDELAKIAEKHGLVELSTSSGLRFFISDKGELFFGLADCFISASPFTSESGEAFLGEKPLNRKSPKNYSALLDKVGAMMPTKSQYDEFAALLMNATGSNTVNGFSRVCDFIHLHNQLCAEDGKFMTYLGEYKALLESFAVFNLECRKVLK